jgi:hypothetical protein
MTFSEEINGLFEHEQWAVARRRLEKRFAEEPHSHWLLTRIGTTYYEEHNYKKAMELSQKAYNLAPTCPLVLWDLASTLEMLGDDLEALKIYGELFARGTRSIAEDECGEGMAWARTLLTDCLYSGAGCLHRLGKERKALWSIQQHLKLRAMGVKSIYALREARTRLREIAGSSDSLFENEIAEAAKELAPVREP